VPPLPATDSAHPTAPRLRYTVLGAVRAWRDGTEVPLGSPQQQALLVALLLREGAPAPIDELVGAVWHTDPPRAAVGTLRTYLSRLRRVLGDSVRSIGGGYALQIEPDALDLAVFRRRVAEGQTLLRTGDAEAAAETLRGALALWPGTALAGIPGRHAESQRTWLAEVRLAAVEARATAELAAGWAGPEQLAGLAALVRDHPLRESFRELYMRALYRAGRQAEALAVYRDGRRRLSDEIGIEPGPTLQRLHQRILAADPTLDATPPAAGPQAGSPHQLPADLPDFTGRAAELRQIADALRADPTAVVGVAGLAGSGRTALAVHAAYRLGDAFPDGLLYADLAEAGPGEILATWLRAFGAGGERLPESVCGRALLLGETIRGRRVLAVLDNVEDPAQVASLRSALPDGGILFTAPRRLAEPAGVTWVRLGPLSTAEAGALLRRLAGPGRVDTEPVAASHIVGLVSGYPLPLRLIGERLRSHPGHGLAEHAERLTGELADVTGPRHDDCVRADAPLLRSYERLSRDQALVLRTAAASGRDAFTAQDLAAALDMAEHRVWAALDTLVDLHLLHETGRRGQFRLDRYLGGFARRQAMVIADRFAASPS